MSKQFETKKEAISLINQKFSTPAFHDPGLKNNYQELEKKYQKLAQRTKQLEKVYQFHKGVVQNISSGIITTDFAGNITFINTAALEVVDYTFQELLNQPIRELFADHQDATEILDELLVQKRMFESREVDLRTRLGKIIPIGFTTALLTLNDDQPQGVIISFRDLTNLRNFRIKMERMDRLATLGEVSAGIAHEIRNPLAGIKTSAQVLEESFGPGDFRAQLVSRIVKEIDRSNDLLKKFFKFAKPGRPKHEYIDIEMTIESVYLLLAPRMKKRNIEFKRNPAKNIPKVYADENQIEQVLINVFLNAVDAMDKGGRLQIATCVTDRNSDATLGKTQQFVEIQITDDGPGIPEEIREKIFNPFFTTKNHGVGLGLSISSRLIEENGGLIEVESKLNRGTTFKLFLPTS